MNTNRKKSREKKCSKSKKKINNLPIKMELIWKKTKMKKKLEKINLKKHKFFRLKQKK